MFDRLRALLLRVLRVPPEPEPPFGDPASIRVFRASRKYYLLRLVGWSIGQVGALIGIAFFVVILMGAEYEAKQRRAAQPPIDANQPASEMTERDQGATTTVRRNSRRRNPVDALAQVPPWAFTLIWALKAGGLIIYVGQVFVTYAALRLDFEMRWYVVTDRSLRIRTGLWKVQEMTMSFANIQQVMVSQGPVQRLLAIADVRVQSAGGGVSRDPHGRELQSLHSGIFHSVDNANEVRDLILDRLRRFRETGLGDPDEHPPAPLPAPGALLTTDSKAAAGSELLQAARELLEESRQLRSTISRPG